MTLTTSSGAVLRSIPLALLDDHSDNLRLVVGVDVVAGIAGHSLVFHQPHKDSRA